ncbi:NADC pyrophosphorylase, partial [Locustella ochotensis]|nr:NADC pyrophosphorylase [Locustella ochotensis]
IECSRADEALEAAGAGADIILVDKLSPQMSPKIRRGTNKGFPHRSYLQQRSMGGSVLGTLPHFLGPHIDVVSMGCLIHSSSALDFALQV